jgi:hypothetical protein
MHYLFAHTRFVSYDAEVFYHAGDDKFTEPTLMVSDILKAGWDPIGPPVNNGRDVWIWIFRQSK